MTEKQEIERDGSIAVKNSGRGFHKGDARLGPFLVDYKEYASSFGVSRKTWAKICTDAIGEGLQPALKLILGSGKDKVRMWVISEDMFNEMYEAWKDANE